MRILPSPPTYTQQICPTVSLPCHLHAELGNADQVYLTMEKGDSLLESSFISVLFFLPLSSSVWNVWVSFFLTCCLHHVKDDPGCFSFLCICSPIFSAHRRWEENDRGEEREGSRESWSIIQILGSLFVVYLVQGAREQTHSKLSPSWHSVQSWGFSADYACPFVMCWGFQHPAMFQRRGHLVSINKPPCNYTLFVAMHMFPCVLMRWVQLPVSHPRLSWFFLLSTSSLPHTEAIVADYRQVYRVTPTPTNTVYFIFIDRLRLVMPSQVLRIFSPITSVKLVARDSLWLYPMWQRDCSLVSDVMAALRVIDSVSDTWLCSPATAKWTQNR